MVVQKSDRDGKIRDENFLIYAHISKVKIHTDSSSLPIFTITNYIFTSLCLNVCPRPFEKFPLLYAPSCHRVQGTGLRNI
jgi:hypothetical protein